MDEVGLGGGARTVGLGVGLPSRTRKWVYGQWGWGWVCELGLGRGPRWYCSPFNSSVSTGRCGKIIRQVIRLFGSRF